MRKFACLAAVSLFFCLTAAAQERATTDVTLGYSFVRQSLPREIPRTSTCTEGMPRSH